MNQKHRIVFLLISLFVLLAVGYATTGSLQFLLGDFWFTAGLLLLLLLSTVDQPHFSRDANVFVNGTAGLISLSTVPAASRDAIWATFLAVCIYLILSSMIIMLRRSRPLSQESRALQLFSRLNREIGKPEALFSAFFLWGVISQFGSDSSSFKALLLYWSIFMIFNLPVVSKHLANYLQRQDKETQAVAGVVTRFHSPRVFESQLDSKRSRLEPGSRVELECEGRTIGFATVIDDRVLLGRRFAKLSVHQTNKPAWASLASEGAKVILHASRENGLGSEEPRSGLHAPIGLVGKGTSIEVLKITVNPDIRMQEGEVLGVELEDGQNAYYQIVSAQISEDLLEDGGLQQVDVSASQLGIWRMDKCRFAPVAWVPPAGSLAHRVVRRGQLEHLLPEGCLLLGTVPNSSFPIHLALEDAVTHNSAIIGVTGSGKSFLAFHVIEGLASLGIRVLILDVSRQHWIFLRDNDPYPIKKVSDLEEWMASDQRLAIHQFADSKSYPERTADLAQGIFGILANQVKLRAGENEPARVCIVIEEAHALIPEWNQVSVERDKNQVNRTARTVLQGRKYGLGCLVISQRTANVTKTILNQCNTIFALQSFDQTGLDFLKNYMGDSYARTISTLPERHAILVGKASSSTRPVMFEVTDFGGRWKAMSEADSEVGGEGG